MFLREARTSVGWIEALVEVHEDMQAVAHRMSHIKVGRLTQGIEVDIIDALKEMLAIFNTPTAKRTPLQLSQTFVFM